MKMFLKIEDKLNLGFSVGFIASLGFQHPELQKVTLSYGHKFTLHFDVNHGGVVFKKKGESLAQPISFLS